MTKVFDFIRSYYDAVWYGFDIHDAVNRLSVGRKIRVRPILGGRRWAIVIVTETKDA